MERSRDSIRSNPKGHPRFRGLQELLLLTVNKLWIHGPCHGPRKVCTREKKGLCSWIFLYMMGINCLLLYNRISLVYWTESRE